MFLVIVLAPLLFRARPRFAQVLQLAALLLRVAFAPPLSGSAASRHGGASELNHYRAALTPFPGLSQ